MNDCEMKPGIERSMFETCMASDTFLFHEVKEST